LLTKSLRPLPDKFHGVHDQELKYRQRYVDLITDEAARRRFAARSKALATMREFMVGHDFLEVETPMLQPIPGGANARPFVTHHNALDQTMHLRNAPTALMKELGHGQGYRYDHNEPNAHAAGQRHLPDGMDNPNWYQPTANGLEAKIADKLTHIKRYSYKY
jgi:elongation factor P--beta-lysine ligase